MRKVKLDNKREFQMNIQQWSISIVVDVTNTHVRQYKVLSGITIEGSPRITFISLQEEV